MKVAKNKSVSKRSKYLLLFGFFFFVNPTPLGFDLLPDVFGCVLVFFGLTQIAYFDGSVEKARRFTLYLFVVEFFRLILMESTATTAIASNRMLSVTAFSLIEGYIYVIIIRSLFEGIGYYSMRNNCNESLKKCDGTAFMSYLAFFIRIAATLLPELLAILELSIYTETDFDTIDSITDLIAAKPVLVVLVSLVALGTGIAWYASVCGTFGTFYKEAGADLDARYSSEYTSRPEMVRPKQLKYGSYALYLALFFALDIVFDGIRIIPASAMFIVIFIATFFFKKLCDFKRTRLPALFAFITLCGAEIFGDSLVPNGAIVIYETDLWIVAVGAVICLIAIPLCLITVRSLFADLRRLQKDLGGSEISTKTAWIWYCVTVVLWSAGYVVPYFHSYVSSLKFISTCIFIWQTVKIISFINEEERERASLYGSS